MENANNPPFLFFFIQITSSHQQVLYLLNNPIQINKSQVHYQQE